MAGTLTIDRTNLGLGDLVFGNDPETGFVLAPGLSFGTITWRKNTQGEDQFNVAGRQLIDYCRASTTVAGTVEIYGASEADLQSKIGEAITALTQVDGTSGFQTFTITFSHGGTLYRCTATEPGDVTPGDDGVFDDVAMDNGNFIQALGFAIVRDPIPLLGPV